jgi:hypothetical protein
MLNRRGVPPHDFVYRQAEHGGNLLPLLWTRRPAAEQNCFDSLLFQPRSFDELFKADVLSDAKFVNCSRHCRLEVKSLRTSSLMVQVRVLFVCWQNPARQHCLFFAVRPKLSKPLLPSRTRLTLIYHRAGTKSLHQLSDREALYIAEHCPLKTYVGRDVGPDVLKITTLRRLLCPHCDYFSTKNDIIKHDRIPIDKRVRIAISSVLHCKCNAIKNLLSTQTDDTAHCAGSSYAPN